jgi:opacity protein-like surface antigen
LKTGGTCSIGDRLPLWRSARSLLLLAAGLALCVSPLHAGDGPLSIILRGNLTTSSLIYLTPDSPDPVARGNTLDITGTVGYGAELRYRIPETSLAVGFSADYIRSRGQSVLNGTPIPVEDGYVAVPLELTGYFIIPLSGEYFGVYMGGGAGVYFGNRTYSIAGVEAASVRNTPGFAIHVLGGISYRFLGSFQGIFEMKFRDLQFQSVDAFRTRSIRFQDTIINVGTDPFTSRVETDGIVFQLGIAYTF